jgi:hypothetical protein
MNKGQNTFNLINKTEVDFQIKMEIKCNPNIKNITFKNIPYIQFNKSSNYTFLAESSNGINLLRVACPIFSLDYFNKSPYDLMLSILIILLGFVIAFFGLKIFSGLIFLSSSFLIFPISFLIFYEWILPNGSENYLFWLGFVGSIIGSLLISLLLSKVPFLFCSLLGALFGLLIGILVCFFIGLIIKLHTLATYLIIAGFILLIAAICLYFYETMCIFLTSIWGSYLLVRVS